MPLSLFRTPESVLFPIIDRVLVSEVSKTLLLVMIVLLLLVMTNAMVALLSDVVAGAISIKVMGALLLVNVVKLSGFMLPPAFFFSILWVLGRMYRDSEVTALHASGAGAWRLYRPFLLVSVPLAILVSALVLMLYPEVRAYGDVLEQKESRQLEVSGFRPGAFNEFNQGKFMAYVGAADDSGEELQDVFVRYRLGTEPGILVAKHARIKWVEEARGRFLVLYDGHRYQGVAGVRNFSSGDFSTYALRLPDDDAKDTELSRSAIPTRELLHASDLKLKAELQRRLAAPLSVFALMLMSVPLAKSSPRQGIYGRLVLAVIIYTVYLNLVQLAVKWMGRGDTPLWMGVWWVPLAGVLLALLITYMNSIAFATRWQRFWMRIR